VSVAVGQHVHGWMKASRGKPLLDLDAISSFCERYAVRRFYLFGSILRDDFGKDSDVDVMVDVGGPFDKISTVRSMVGELEALFGRKVDLVSLDNVERGSISPRYRYEILKTSCLVYNAT
jgi:predicted nucleotidyltransferase